MHLSPIPNPIPIGLPIAEPALAEVAARSIVPRWHAPDPLLWQAPAEPHAPAAPPILPP